MFDGGNKRKVNLKRNKTQDSKELLLNLKRNRERLKVERQRREAAAVLQKYYRRILALKKLRPSIRARFDGTRREIIRGIRQEKKLPLAINLAGLLRLRLFCDDPREGDVGSQLANCVSFLQKSYLSKDVARNYFSLISRPETLGIWRSQTESLANILLSHLLYEPGSGDAWQKRMSTYVFLLSIIFDPTRWGINPDREVSSILIAALFKSMVLKRDFYGQLRLVILMISPRDQKPQSSRLDPSILRLLSLLLFRGTAQALAVGSVDNPEVIMCFLKEILTIPLLWSRLQALEKPVLFNEASKVLPIIFDVPTESFGVLIETTPSYSGFDHANCPAIPLHSSSMDLEDDDEDSSSEEDDEKKEDVMHKVHRPALSRGAWFCGNLLEWSTHTEMNVGPGLLLLLGHYLPNIPARFFPSHSIVHPLFEKQIDLITSKPVLEHLGRIDNLADENNIALLSSMIKRIFELYPEVQTKMLQRLAWNTGITQRLWQLFRSRKLQPHILMPRGKFSGPFDLFCRVLGYQLRTVTDEDLIDRGLLIPKAELPTLVVVIRSLLVKLFSVEKLRDSETYSLRSIASAVFSDLRERQSRKKFCLAGEWLFPGLIGDGDILMRELMQQDGRRRLIAKHIPFVIPFETRVKMFYTFIDLDKEHSGAQIARGHGEKADIRRTHIFEDGYKAFMDARDVKARVQIRFINEQGMPEAGIDGGGLFKEFMNEITKIVYNPNYGLFLENSNHELYPSAHSAETHIRPPALDLMMFLGLLLGKALYDGVLIELQFANFFLRKLLGKTNFLEDLRSLDKDIYKSLRLVMQSTDVESLSLTFSLTERVFGKMRETDLIENGRMMPVTLQNRLDYVTRLTRFKLNKQIAQQSRAFMEGLSSIISRDWIKMFTADELQTLISGTPSVDLEDLKVNTYYQGGLHSSQPLIKWLWEVLEDYDDEQVSKFLMFVTSCSRAPLLGFKALEPKFGIMSLRGRSPEMLPLASTCMNLLKLPPYRTKSQLRAKLTLAINANAGFDMS